jgi:hypothetical protein
MVKRILLLFVVLAVLSAVTWASDRITFQGERTIHTVDCVQGVWVGLRCTGTLMAGDRYRYRSLKTRREIIFWIAGSPQPSGKYTDCTVKDRGNWLCKESLDKAPSITHEMVNDQAKRDPNGHTLPFHAVPKWKWWLLHAGLTVFHEASY